MLPRTLLLTAVAVLLGACAADEVAMDCAAETATPGEPIVVTAAVGPTTDHAPAFVIRPISGAMGSWTMVETTATGAPWDRVHYRGEFAAASAGRFRLEAVLGAGRTVASCDVVVHPARVALLGISQ